MLNYPTHIYNPIIPKVALTEHNHYCFSAADNIGESAAENKRAMMALDRSPELRLAMKVMASLE